MSKTVDEACLLLAEYNGRLAAELEDRKQLARMLTEYIGSQKEALAEREKKLDVRQTAYHELMKRSLSESVLMSLIHPCLGLFAGLFKTDLTHISCLHLFSTLRSQNICQK